MFRRSLGPRDHVVFEAAGGALAIARILAPYAGREVMANPPTSPHQVPTTVTRPRLWPSSRSQRTEAIFDYPDIRDCHFSQTSNCGHDATKQSGPSSLARPGAPEVLLKLEVDGRCWIASLSQSSSPPPKQGVVIFGFNKP